MWGAGADSPPPPRRAGFPPKGEQVRNPGSTNRHTHSVIMAHIPQTPTKSHSSLSQTSSTFPFVLRSNTDIDISHDCKTQKSLRIGPHEARHTPKATHGGATKHAFPVGPSRMALLTYRTPFPFVDPPRPRARRGHLRFISPCRACAGWGYEGQNGRPIDAIMEHNGLSDGPVRRLAVGGWKLTLSNSAIQRRLEPDRWRTQWPYRRGPHMPVRKLGLPRHAAPSARACSAASPKLMRSPV